MKRIRTTAAHGLLWAMIMLVGASTGTEAMAQRGRAETSRLDKSSRVERRNTKSTDKSRVKATTRKDSRSQKKAVQREKARTPARAVERGSRSDSKAVKRTKGRSGSAKLAGNRSRSDNVRGRESQQKARVVRKNAGSRSRGSRANNERPSGGDRHVGDRGDRDDRGDRRSDVRGGRSDSRVAGGNRSIYIGDRKPERYRRNPDRHRTGPVKTHRKHKNAHYYGHRKHFNPYRHNRLHRTKYAWCNVYHPAGHHHYIDAHIHIGSHLQIGVRWPWKTRFHRHWRPRYRYRQVVYVDAGWGGHRRSSRVDVRTYYRHRVLHANDRYAEIEIEVDAIELYQNDQYLSTIDRIPGQLRKLRATVYADGRIDFDRNVFLIGDARSGFELIATRYYNDYLYNAYDAQHGYRVGRVNLRNGKVKMKKHSRLFDPYNFGGFVPISLLPDDDRLWDYSRPYLEGSYRGEGDGTGWYRNYRDREYDYDDDYELSRNFDISYRTPQGAEIRMERSTYVDRLD